MKEMVKVSASNDETARSIEVPYDFGDNLDQACELFNDNIVFEGFVSDATVGLQGFVRRLLKLEGDKIVSDEDILLKASEWRPGAKPKKSALDKAMELLGKLSAEEKAAVLASIGK
jgi:hypothetical protein